MISFEEASKIVGYDRSLTPPDAINAWYAYKNGEAKKFDSEQSAKQFSNNVERVVGNQASIDDFWARQRALECLAANLWLKNLRAEFSSVSDAVFDACYDQAYQDGHAYGYDEVAQIMIKYIEFAQKIQACN